MSSITFKQMLQFMVESEGSTYTNDPRDRGGPTKYGITLESLREYQSNQSLNAEDVKSLSLDYAIEIYINKYVKKPKFDGITNDWVKYAIVDFGLNSGTSRAAKIAQELLNNKFGFKLTVDGIFGQNTLLAINSVDNDKFFILYNDCRIRFLGSIAQDNPTFIKGWLNRVTGIIDRKYS